MNEVGLSGKSLADLLSKDLQDIKEINRLKQEKPPVSLWKEGAGFPTVIEAQARSIINPKPYVEISSLSLTTGSEVLDYHISQVGTIGMEQTTLSVGQLLLSMKELTGNRLNTITCSLQRYGKIISIVAILDERGSKEP